MADRIMRSAVRCGKVTYAPGDEDQLNEVITHKEIKYLKGKGILFGAGWTGVAPERVEGEPWSKNEKVEPVADAETALPENLHMRKQLIEAGFDTVERIQAAPRSSLMAIPKIGDATVKRIRAELLPQETEVEEAE